MPGSEGEKAAAEARRTLAAAEAALKRQEQLAASIARGERSIQEIQQAVRRGVVRDAAAGATAEPASAKGERATSEEVTSRTSKATQAQKEYSSAVADSERAQAGLVRSQGESIGQLDQLTSRLKAMRQLGPLGGQNVRDAIGRNITAGYTPSQLAAQQAAYQQRQPIAALPQQAEAGRQPFIVGSGGAGTTQAPTETVRATQAIRQQAAATEETVTQTKAYSVAQNEARATTQGMYTELSRVTQVQSLAGESMRQYGALTTEFFQAAGRGEVTIRELGFQTTATISKFGGWLGAGAAVYGVLGAVTALGKGALDSYAGVNQLQRVITRGVDPSSLRKSFRDLSGEFNLPIGTVTDAVYQMGKVFHNTDDALAASKAVLYSVKVGELDVADATRYLISTVQGFQLPASQLETVFNQINAAQNKFGISIGDVEAGLAKASGQFRQSGGDVSHLLAIITTAQRVTGNTGQVIGTAVSRAPNFLRQASNQQALESFGIKASTNVQQVITQAFDVADKLSGSKLQELSAAIFGPQYGARVGTALLANKSLYEKVLKETSPEAANRNGGSAYRELQTQLGGVNEQLSKVGVTLERIGGALAEAHGFDAFGALLKLLNTSLTAANSLLETFNKLPDGVQRTLSYMAQIAILIRVLRRFSFGEFVAGGPGQNPGGVRGAVANAFNPGSQGVATQYRSGLYNEQKFLTSQNAQLTSEQAKAQIRVIAAQERLNAITKDSLAVINNTASTEEEVAAAKIRMAAAEGRVLAAENRVAEIAETQAIAATRLGQVETSIGATGRRARDYVPFLGGGGRTQRTYQEAERTGATQYFPATNDRPTTVPPVRFAQVGEAEKAAMVEAERGAQAITTSQAGVATAAEGALSEAVRADAVAEGAATRTGLLAKGMGAMGVAFNRLIGSFGNLLFAGFALSLIIDQVHNLADKVGEQTDALSAGVDSVKAQKQQYQQVEVPAINQTNTSFGDRLRNSAVDFFTGSGSGHGPLEQLFGIGSSQGIADQQSGVARSRQAQYTDRLAAQASAMQQGIPVPYRPISDIEKDISALKRQDLSRKETLKKLRFYDQELKRSMEAIDPYTVDPTDTKGVQAKATKAEADLKRTIADNASVRTLADKIKSLPADELTAGLDASLAVAGYTTGSKQKAAFNRARIYFEQINQTLGQSKDQKDIKAFEQARQSFYDGITQTIQTDLSNALLLSKSPTQRATAYTDALRTARQQLISQPQSELQQEQQQLQGLRDRLNKEQQANAGLPGGNFFGYSFRPYDTKDLKALQNKIKGQSQEAKQLRDYVQQSEQQFKLIRAQIKDQQFQEQDAVRQARESVLEGQTADPLKQAAEQISFLGDEIDRAIKEYGKGSQQVLQLISQREQAQQQQIQAGIALFQAQQGLKYAGITNQQQAQKAAVAKAQAYLAYLQGLPQGSVDPAEIINAEAAVKDAQAQLVQTTLQDVQAFKDALFDIRAARANAAGNEVAAARAELAKAIYDVSAAQTPTARRQAQAGVIQQRAALRDAINQREIDDVQYQADIGKLTLDQQITAYRHLLNTLNLTRDARRNLKEKIYQLQQQEASASDSLDLNVGNIKLPTTYEIRRALQGGVTGPQTNVNVKQDNKITINVRDAKDAAKVGREIDKHVNGGAANAMRSAGIG